MNSYDPTYVSPDYTTTTTTTMDPGVFLMIMMIGLVVLVVTYVIFAFLLGRIFAKAGVPQWKAWVPIYSNWVMLELGDQQGFWAVLALIPFVNLVSTIFMFIAMYKIGLKLGKDGAFVLLAIFLPAVWFIWLAVDKSTWQGAKPAAATPPTATPPSQPNAA